MVLRCKWQLFGVCVGGASANSYSLNGLLAKFFFGEQWAILFGPPPKEIETWEAAQNSSFFVRMELLAHLDR